jgi:hypothetical protein
MRQIFTVEAADDIQGINGAMIQMFTVQELRIEAEPSLK